MPETDVFNAKNVGEVATLSITHNFEKPFILWGYAPKEARKKRYATNI
jgi:hypothetical protein